MMSTILKGLETSPELAYRNLTKELSSSINMPDITRHTSRGILWRSRFDSHIIIAK
jgi:hypothetical protein